MALEAHQQRAEDIKALLLGAITSYRYEMTEVR